MPRRMGKLRRLGHVFVRVFRIIRSPRVPLADKMLFLVPAVLYAVLPDALPMVPLDDIAVVLIAAAALERHVRRKYPGAGV